MVKPGYKQTDLGLLPEEWACREIGSFADVCMCKRIFAEQTSEMGEIPFYKIGTFGKKADAYISRLLFEEYKQKYSYPQKGDVLISAAGTLGRTVVYDGEEAYFQDSNIVWLDIDKSQISNDYLYHYYKVIKWTPSEGSTIARLYNGIITSTNVAVPPKPEQEAIAEVLSDIDALIVNLEKLIAKKKAIKQGAMQELLTGKRRLPGFDGEWAKMTMDSYVDFQVGFPFSSSYFNNGSDGLRLVKNRDLKSDDQVYFTSEPYAPEYVVENGDILVGMDGDFLPCRWQKGKALLNQRVGRLLPKKNLDGLFAYYAFQNPLAELQNGTGATTVKHLSHGDIKKLVVPMPPTKKEQTAIAEILSDMDSELEEFNQILVKYRLIRQGMMSELLTGRIRLVEQL